MFFLKRQVSRSPFNKVRKLPYRNVHQKPPENATHNKNKNNWVYLAGSGTFGIAWGIMTYYYLQMKSQQTYNSSSLNDKQEESEGKITTIIRSPREATSRLRENQLSFLLQRNNGIWRYDSNQLGSNYPVEDMKSEEIVFSSSTGNKKRNFIKPHITVGDRLFFGVYDGHSGWNTSQILSKKLIPKVKEHLDKAIEGYGEYSNLISDKQELTKKAIENAFVEVDDEIVYHSVKKLLNTKELFSVEDSIFSAMAGSCAIMAYVDAIDKDLYIACTGDSRAVLGVKEDVKGEGNEKGGKRWKAVVLSEDQTGRNENEVKRIEKEHPGEKDIVMNGRVFGLEPTRAFGDSRYKWDLKTHDAVYSKFFKMRRGMFSGNRNKTPPYVIARPEVTHHKLTGNDKFLVIATDGLWDELSNEQVVELVGEFLDGKRDIIEEEINLLPDGELDEKTYRQKRVFTFVDENAATHLIRNALGGARQDLLCNLLSIPPPISRRFRDDITVTVVFFGPDNQKDVK